jgi:pimeloyl-ACP methyl ester carboxylesterase
MRLPDCRKGLLAVAFVPFLVMLVAPVASAQTAASVRNAAADFRAEAQNLTPSERSRTNSLEQEAEQAAQAGRFGDALRAYAHAAAVLRKAEWTPALELASAIEMRVDHVLLEPGKPVVLSLTARFPAQSEAAKLLASVFLIPAELLPEKSSPAEREIVPTWSIEPARLPFVMRFAIPDTAPGNYALEVRLAPPDSSAPPIVHDWFLKAVPVHIENLSQRAANLRARLANAPPGPSPNHDAALATAQYVLEFYQRVDSGEFGLRRFNRYSFAEQFASANAILDDLEAGRDPFAAKAGDFHRAYRSRVDRTLQPYRLFVPDAYDGSRAFPLVIALHGGGGDENDFFDSYREAPLEPEAQRLGFLVVCPRGRGPKSGYRGAGEQDVFDVLAEVRRVYRIDPRRIYLMGHSMGAYATWRLAAAHPDLFAAIGPIAGGGDPADMVKLRDVPQYVVHGALDLTVPVSQSRAMVAAARKAGAKVVYVELPNAGHYDAAIGQFGPMLDFFAKQARK